MLWKFPKDPALTSIIFEVIWPFKSKKIFKHYFSLAETYLHLCKSHVLTAQLCALRWFGG